MKDTKRGTVMVSALLAVLCLAQTASAFYAPNHQRWVNRDPFGEEGGVNLYTSMANNPASLTDSLGLDTNDPVYKPGDWNKGGKFQGENNCCNYAYNLPGNTQLPDGQKVPFNLQPGRLGGMGSPGKMDCIELRKRVKKDWKDDTNTKNPGTGKCPDGYHKVKMWLASDGVGFHLMRQDGDGNWSDKKDQMSDVNKCNPKTPRDSGDQDCGDICVPNTYK